MHAVTQENAILHDNCRPAVDELGDTLGATFDNENPMSITISVMMTRMALVTEKSSPNSACCVASPITISNTKSKDVSSPSVLFSN